MCVKGSYIHDGANRGCLSTGLGFRVVVYNKAGEDVLIDICTWVNFSREPYGRHPPKVWVNKRDDNSNSEIVEYISAFLEQGGAYTRILEKVMNDAGMKTLWDVASTNMSKKLRKIGILPTTGTAIQ